MRHTLPGRKLVEDRTSGNPDKLLPFFRLLLDRIAPAFVTSEVEVPVLHEFGSVQVITFRDDGMWMSARRDRDFTLFTCNDEVAKVSSVCTIKIVFQPLIRG